MTLLESLGAPGAHAKSEQAIHELIQDFGADEATAQLLEEFAERIRSGQYPVIEIKTQTTAQAPDVHRRGNGRVFKFAFTVELDTE